MIKQLEAKSKAKPHGFVTRSIHWVTAGLLGYGYLKGLNNVGQLADPSLFWFEIYFALALGAAFIVRLLWTKSVAGTSRLPEDAPKWEHRASKAVQIGLYASVFAIILSGLGIAFGFATPALGGWFVAAMVGLHEVSLVVLPALLMIHIAGALWHKFVRRDGVMESMTGKLPI